MSWSGSLGYLKVVERWIGGATSVTRFRTSSACNALVEEWVLFEAIFKNVSEEKKKNLGKRGDLYSKLYEVDLGYLGPTPDNFLKRK
jgi:hypothetical protein